MSEQSMLILLKVSLLCAEVNYHPQVESTEGELPGSIEDTEKALDKHEQILTDIAQKQKDVSQGGGGNPIKTYYSVRF